MKVGRRLAIKILNASRFALGMEAEPAEPAAPLDRSMLATLRGVLREVTEAFDDYEHARALSMLERFFWGFTDDYLELVKQRAYGGAGRRAARRWAPCGPRSTSLLRRSRPSCPYVTEEVWSWWREGSVHRSAWPTEDELAVSDGADPEVYEVAAAVLGAVRKEKALAKVSLRVPATLVTVHDLPPYAGEDRRRARPTSVRRAGSWNSGRSRPSEEPRRVEWSCGSSEPDLMRFDEALARLDARQPEHMPGPSLDRIRAIVELLDHPELTYPTIHVTGTNGKTTAARVAAAVACAHGISTGLFTSPHLLSVTERFDVCGEPIAEDAFAEEWEHLEPVLRHVDELGFGEVTYFEALTALAFLSFADKPVALGVFEVGMGGSWDATNLVAGDVAIVTPIAMDHVAELGPTLADIAGEKAGVLKPDTIGVIREQAEAAAEVLRRRAADVGCAAAVGGRRLGGRGTAPRGRRPVVPPAGPLRHVRGPLPPVVRRVRGGERRRRRRRVRGAHRAGARRGHGADRPRERAGPRQARDRRA